MKIFFIDDLSGVSNDGKELSNIFKNDINHFCENLKRYDDFYKESLPVKDWYEKTNRVDLVDASGSIDEVLEIIKLLI